MNKLVEIVLTSSPSLTAIGFCILRIGIGVLFIIHGYGKLSGGTQTFIWLGSTMKNFGITSFPFAWGLAAALSEFLGGICITLGFATRLWSILLFFCMIVALFFHVNKGDQFTVYSHALTCIIVFMALICAGSGCFSIDSLLKK